jgi:hypothetical protein
MRPELQATVTQIGLVASECLALGQAGQVLASVSNAIYLLSDDGELFWLSTEAGALHRRCALVLALPPKALAGSRFYVEGRHLVIEPAFVVDIQPAVLWQAPSLQAKGLLRASEISARVQTLIDSLDLTEATGFGPLIFSIKSLAKGATQTSLPKPVDSIPAVTQPFVLAFFQACLQADSAGISKQADALIGLGAGLTPSGDDFLGGFLFALEMMKIVYPDLNFLYFMPPIESYDSRTNLISFTLLGDLAAGHAPAPLHHLLNCFLHSRGSESALFWVRQLTQMGHSTGWDLLTGLLTGLLFAHRSTRYVRSDPMVSLAAA